MCVRRNVASYGWHTVDYDHPTAKTSSRSGIIVEKLLLCHAQPTAKQLLSNSLLHKSTALLHGSASTQDSIPLRPVDPRSTTMTGTSAPPTPLIVFDWDDTLLPSSWLQRENYTGCVLSALPQSAQTELRAIEVRIEAISTRSCKCLCPFDRQWHTAWSSCNHVRLVCCAEACSNISSLCLFISLALSQDAAIVMLKLAQSLGSVVIITNAEVGWVQLSAKRFFKRMVPELKSIPIISARSSFESQFPGAPLSWKAAAFAYTLHEHYSSTAHAPKLVVSIGDSNEERLGLRIAATQHTQMHTATIKLLPQPSTAALAAQLDMCVAALADVCTAETLVDTEIILQSSCVKSHILAARAAATAAATIPAAVAAASSSDKSSTMDWVWATFLPNKISPEISRDSLFSLKTASQAPMQLAGCA